MLSSTSTQGYTKGCHVFLVFDFNSFCHPRLVAKCGSEFLVPFKCKEGCVWRGGGGVLWAEFGFITHQRKSMLISHKGREKTIKGTLPFLAIRALLSLPAPGHRNVFSGAVRDCFSPSFLQLVFPTMQTSFTCKEVKEVGWQVSSMPKRLL